MCTNKGVRTKQTSVTHGSQASTKDQMSCDFPVFQVFLLNKTQHRQNKAINSSDSGISPGACRGMADLDPQGSPTVVVRKQTRKP